jgi:hypothetical protein
MVFFANSGNALPHLEQKTREAGASTLQAAAEFWQVLGDIEGRASDFAKRDSERERLQLCVDRLRNAATTYQSMLDQIPPDRLWEVSEAELQVAALDMPSLHQLPYYRPRHPRRVNLKHLYAELIEKLQRIADEILALDWGGSKEDLAPQVFILMRRWENLTNLGRLIVVVNHRDLGYKSYEAP